MYVSHDILEIILIIILIIYIIYLQIQLIKKNNILNSIYKKIERPNSKLKKEDILVYLDSFNNPNFSDTSVKDKILDKKILDFLFEDESNIKLFLHYTPTENNAQQIINSGFKFVTSFYKTAQLIYNDELYFINRHHEHKQFGNYVVIICISKKIYNKYTLELSKISSKNIAVEQILTESEPVIDENHEEVYTLPLQYIKGYFNYKTGKIVKNNNYNSEYNSNIFNDNLNKLK